MQSFECVAYRAPLANSTSRCTLTDVSEMQQVDREEQFREFQADHLRRQTKDIHAIFVLLAVMLVVFLVGGFAALMISLSS